MVFLKLVSIYNNDILISRFPALISCFRIEILASFPCKTEEERVIKNRKAFLLHNIFVDVSIFKVVASILNVIDSRINAKRVVNCVTGRILYVSQGSRSMKFT